MTAGRMVPTCPKRPWGHGPEDPGAEVGDPPNNKVQTHWDKSRHQTSFETSCTDVETTEPPNKQKDREEELLLAPVLVAAEEEGTGITSPHIPYRPLSSGDPGARVVFCIVHRSASMSYIQLSL
jgi:hypothetical protein